MSIDIRTLVIITGITHLIQVAVLIHQYKTLKAYPGIGWWLLWSLSEIIGFSALVMRGVPGSNAIFIVLQNSMIVLGTIFVYIGILRFAGKKEKPVFVWTLYGLYAAALVFFVYAHNDIRIRSILINFALALTAFEIARVLIMHRGKDVAASANFNAAVSIIHGAIFAYRFVAILNGTDVSDIFASSLFNELPYLDALVVGLLWTFGFVLMLNQRLNADMLDMKDHFELIFSTGPDATLITRAEDGLILDINQGFTRITGFTREDAVGQSSLGLHLWKDPADRQKVVDTLLEKGECNNYEALFLRKNGSELTGLISAKIIKLRGKPHIISVTRDISERVETQQKLKESEELYRSLFDNMLNGFAYCEMEYRDGRPYDFTYVSVNAAFESLTGLKNVTGKKVSVVIPGIREADYPLLEIYGRVAETGSPESFEMFVESLRDWYEVSVYSPKKGFFIAVFDVITKRKNAEEEAGKLLEESEHTRVNLLSVLEDQMRTAEALRESQEIFTHFMIHSPVYVFFKDEQIRSLRLSKNFEQMLGRPLDDLLGKNMFELFPSDFAKQMVEDDKRILASGKLEVLNEELNGRFYTTIKFPIHIDGKPKYLAGYTIDVSEQQQAAVALAKSEERYRGLLQHLEAGVVVHAPDTSIVMNNLKASELLGLSSDQMKGKVAIDPDWKFIREDHTPLSLEEYPVNRVIRSMKPLYDAVLGIHQPGSTNLVWVLVNGFPAINDRGEMTEVVISFIDITRRKLAEENLILQKRLSDIFLAQPDDEMYHEILNVVQELLESQFGVFGYLNESGDLVVPSMSRHIWDKCNVKDKALTFYRDTWGESSWPTAIREKRVVCSNEESKLIPEGHISIQNNIALPIIYKDDVIGLFQVANKESGYDDADIDLLGRIAEYIAPVLSARIQRDRNREAILKLNAELEQRVTERTARLQEVNYELEAFSYSVSHDLRAPLRSINGFAKILLEEYSAVLDAEGNRLFQVIRDNAERMSRLIDDLLSFSRVGRRELGRDIVSMKALANSTYHEAASDEERKRITFILGDLPDASADPALVRQLWYNVMSNAVKFSARKPHPVIEAGFMVKNDRTTYFVKDNGSGFDMKYYDKLFGVFQRLHTDEEFPGTGVGLALVKRIVTRHGGEVWAESELGEGTVVYFSMEQGVGSKE